MRLLRSDLLVLGLAGVPILLFVGHSLSPGAALYAGPLDAEGRLALGALVKLALLGAAAGWAFASSRCFAPDNPMRSAWSRLAAGLTAMAGGQLALAPYQLVWQLPSPFPSVADAAFVAAYPLLFSALMRFRAAFGEWGFGEAGRAPRSRDALLAMTLAVVALPALWPVITVERPLLETALNLVYPALDLVLLAPALLLLRDSLAFRGGAVWPVWLALVASFAALTVGDAAFGYFTSLERVHLESLVDALYVGAYGSALYACARQHRLLAPDAAVSIAGLSRPPAGSAAARPAA